MSTTTTQPKSPPDADGGAVVPRGYRRTDVGVIPQDWRVLPLRACLRNPPGYGINAAAVAFDDNLPTYLRITDIGDDSRFRPSPRVSVKHPNVAAFFLGDGDLVFARTGASVGKSYLYDPNDGPLIFAGFLIRVRPDPAALEPAFLAYYVQSKRYWDWVATMSIRSGQPGVNGQEYGTLQLPLPEIGEQRAIAKALSDVDGLIEALEKLIAKKRAIKLAAMQQLLTGKTRLPGFSGKWETKRLGDVCGITTGRKDVNEGNPEGQFRFFTCSRTYTYSDSYSFDGEAILIAGNGDVGNLHYYKGQFEAYQRTYVLFDFSMNVSYLWQQLDAHLASSLGIGKIGSSIPYIKKGDLVGFEFKSPIDEQEQTAISSVLSDMDAEIAALERRRDKTKQIKQGMMQQLLTGRIRLVNRGAKA